jgi:predicted phosphodiesterase
MHRIALISDIHGNEVALSAVLADIRRRRVDAIACLGDVATLGPRPREVLQLVRAHCAYFILGNHDEYMLAPELIQQHTREPSVVDSVLFCRDELEDDDLRFIQGFERQRELPLGAAGILWLFHGSPASNNCDLLAETPADELDRQLGAPHATLMAAGHTHIQMLRQHRGALLINPGSVGLPFERYEHGGPPTIMPFAEYALVEADGRDLAVTLHRVNLDIEALIEQTRSWRAPLAGYLLAQYERSAAKQRP